MKWYAGIGIAHALLTASGWYFVAAAAQGAADSSAEIPPWLHALNDAVLILLLPLGRLALRRDPAFGDFSIAGFAELALVVAANSTLLAVVAWLVIGGVKRASASLGVSRSR